MKKILALLALTALASTAQAQFNLTTTNYTQNFNSLGTNASSVWANNTTLPGWFALGPLTNPVVIANQTGTGTSGTLANFSSTATTADRSLGWVFANNIGVAGNYASIGFGLSNSTGLNLDSFSLAYTGREWRGYSNNTPVLSFQYKIGGSFDNDPTNSLTGSWTDFSSLNFVLPVTNNNARVDGLVAPNFTTLSNSATGLSWGTGQVLWLRWRQQNLSGTDAQLALDDIVFGASGALISGGNYWAADPAGGGSGTWTSAGTTWATNTGGAGAGQTQSGSTLIFADTAGTVTVSGGVTVSNGMTFQTTGYNLQGSTITLAGATAANNAITTDTGVTTTISSELAGTTGMTKSGSGTLVLSGANTFSGNATISGGTLEITNDSALGDAANDLANNGTLKTTTSVSLGAGRDLSGSGTYDIANGTTLTVNGNANNTATALANTGTLDLQGATRTLGSVTINAPMTLNAVGAVSVTGLTAPGVSSGTAIINPDIIFTTSGDKTLNVAAGGIVDLNGTLTNSASTTSRIAKTGSGTLILSAANNMGGLRVGASGASPTEGGTVVLENSAIGTQAQAIQHNYGTLRAASNLVFTNGLSIGGRTNGAALLAGSNMEFQGQSAFFRGTGTTGELVLNVDNTTTFSGGFAASSGGGTATGITIGGTGMAVIGGISTNLVEAVTLTDTAKLRVNSSLGSTNVAVSSGTAIGGNGTIAGNMSLAAGAGFMIFDLNAPLTVVGSVSLDSTFSIASLLGAAGTAIDWSLVADGTYTLINSTSTFSNIQNFGEANKTSIGGDRFAYFSDGSLQLNVVPEPSTYALLVLSAAGLGAHMIRRRRR
jgi:autotransporter-associated beta strand protein